MGGVDPTLASKCLDLCQALVGQAIPFTFSLTMGSTFSLSLDTRGKEVPPSSMLRKKRSPSAARRNTRSREQLLQSSWSSEVKISDPKSVMLKLKKNPPKTIPQLDGQEEEVTKDAEAQTDDKREGKHAAVQTMKPAPELVYLGSWSWSTELPRQPLHTNMGPYEPPHHRRHK